MYLPNPTLPLPAVRSLNSEASRPPPNRCSVRLHAKPAVGGQSLTSLSSAPTATAAPRVCAVDWSACWTDRLLEGRREAAWIGLPGGRVCSKTQWLVLFSLAAACPSICRNCLPCSLLFGDELSFPQGTYLPCSRYGRDGYLTLPASLLPMVAVYLWIQGLDSTSVVRGVICFHHAVSALGVRFGVVAGHATGASLT